MVKKKTYKYTDLNIFFSPHPVTGELMLVRDEEAIKQSIKLLVLTNFYERFMQPKLGSNVRYHLFENISPITAFHIKKEIERVIINYEPRGKILRLDVTANPDRNYFKVKLVYQAINLLQPIQIEMFLERRR